jgi:Tol biopolymer transport system component
MHGKSLWVSRADGSQRRQIEVPALEMELPSWAPDGRSIAFMARLPDSPWRIFVVPTAGGSPSEASSGTDNQGAPTWSPDGRWLMYGNVKCQEVGSCAIRKVNLSTGQVLTLPGSEGMGTARWSPNGRYVAALYTERHQVYTLDVHSGRWQKMADNVSGNDLNWSADSRYLFASRPIGDKPEVLRMSLANGKVESAVDLSDFSKMGGRVDTWFGIAPDGSIIFMRWLDQTDVYSLKFEER